jgi:hypothetical protein
MRNAKRSARVFAAVAATCLLTAAPVIAQVNWTQVPNYIDVSGRMTAIETSIMESYAAGRLTQAQAASFKSALDQIKAQETAFRSDGKLSMMERVKIVVDLDKLNSSIQSAQTERKVAITDVAGHEADIDRLIQESLLSGRLTSLEALGFKRSLADIRVKEQALRADGALSANDLLALSLDLDKLSANIEQSLRTRTISDPGIESKKVELKKRIDDLAAAGRITAQQADLFNQDLNKVIAREASFKASGNILDNDEKLALGIDLEWLKSQLDRLQPESIPTAVKGIDEQQAEIAKAINDAKAAGKLTVQDASDLMQEYARIESLEAMFRADSKLSDSEILTLSRDLQGLSKAVTDSTGKVQVPGLEERKIALKKKIVDGQAAGRFKPESLATDFLNEFSRLEAKEQFYKADGSLNDMETLVIADDVEALSTKVESSLSALPNVAQQKDTIERNLNDALASGRLDPAKADEIRQDLQRIAYLDNTFRGNDGVLDERETVALNKEYNNLQARLNRELPALPNIDTLQSEIEKKLADGQSSGSIDAATAASIKKEFDRIASVESSFRSSEQSLSEWETMALKRDLDRLASDIDRISKSGPPVTAVDLSAGSADTKGHWAQQYIAILQQRGTIGGFPDGTFKPDQGITRSQFAAIAVKALGLPSGGREVEFRDLPKTHWAYKAICSASDAGLVGGFPDGSFRPEDKLTRAQALVILAKALSKGTSDTAVLDKYKDGNGVAAWAAPSVAKAASAGIVVNYPDPYSIRPADLATRAEVAALTYQTMANLGQKLPAIRIGLEASGN